MIEHLLAALHRYRFAQLLNRLKQQQSPVLLRIKVAQDLLVTLAKGKFC